MRLVIDVAEAPGRPSGWTYPSFLAASLWTLLILVTQVATVLIAAAAWWTIGGAWTSSQFEHGLMMLGTVSTAATALVVCLLLFGRRTPRVVGWRVCSGTQWLSVLVLAAPLAVVTSEFANWTEIAMRNIQPDWLRDVHVVGQEGISELNDLHWWLVLLFFCLLPGFGEELYWRGFLARGLMCRYGAGVGAMAASFLFGVIHIFPVQAFAAFLLGIVMQIVFVTTRSLPAAMTLHALNNALAFGLARFEQLVWIPGLSESTHDSVVHVPMPLLASAAAATACLVAMLIKTRTFWKLPDGSIWSPGYTTAELPPVELQAAACTGRAGRFVLTAASVTTALFAAAVVSAAVMPAGL